MLSEEEVKRKLAVVTAGYFEATYLAKKSELIGIEFALLMVLEVIDEVSWNSQLSTLVGGK